MAAGPLAPPAVLASGGSTALWQSSLVRLLPGGSGVQESTPGLHGL
jgi:hypothetical protein